MQQTIWTSKFYNLLIIPSIPFPENWSRPNTVSVLAKVNFALLLVLNIYDSALATDSEIPRTKRWKSKKRRSRGRKIRLPGRLKSKLNGIHLAVAADGDDDVDVPGMSKARNLNLSLNQDLNLGCSLSGASARTLPAWESPAGVVFPWRWEPE